MSYDPEKTSEYFDQFGMKEWERLESSPHGKLKYQIHIQFIEKHLPNGALVLDAGCGPGRFAIALAKLGARIVLVDISGAQLQIARQKIREAGVADRIEGCHRLDICDLSPLEDRAFDMTLCYGGALSYVCENYETALSELIHVTKPRSPLLLSVMSFYGAMRLGMVLDDDAFFSDVSSHLKWNGRGEVPGFVCTRPGSPEFHAPMGLYTSAFLRELLEGAGCEVIEMASSNALSSGLRGGLEKIGADNGAREMALSLERRACMVPGLLDVGEHIIAVALTP